VENKPILKLRKKNFFLINLLSSMLWLISAAFPAKAQINFNITQSNIGMGSIYVDNQSIQYTALASVNTTIGLKATSNYFTKGTNPTTLNTNLFRARAIGSGGQSLNLITSNAALDATLTSTTATIYSNMLSLLTSGLVNIRYTIPNPALYAWKSGTYSNTLNFSLSNMLGGTLTVKANIVNVTVDPFITVTPTQNIVFNIDALNLYRNTAISPKSQTISMTSTLNPGIRTKSSTDYFTYSNGYLGGTDPRAPATVIMAQMTTPKIRTAELLTGTTAKTMTEAAGIEVPTGNTSMATMSYSLSNEVLKTNFLKKGTYTLNLNHEIFDAEESGTITPQNLSSTFVVNVADMAELVVNDRDINLVFKTAADYKNGVYVDMPAHVSLSATSPYDVFVQSSSSTLSNGSNSIPVSALQISAGTSDGTTVVPIVLNATRQRMLGILPIIDKKINIRYSISAAEAAKLIGKASGTYTTSITYSLIAP
jgi:hypothetical protein